MTLKFAKHNDNCWHAFHATFAEITQDGSLKVLGEIVDMNDEDGLDGSLGYINFINGVPVWNSNVVGNANCGVTDDLNATQRSEIADFMEILGVPPHSDLAELGPLDRRIFEHGLDVVDVQGNAVASGN